MDSLRVLPPEHMLNYLPDEILVHIAQVSASRSARDVLTNRYLRRIACFVAKRVALLRLPSSEVEDAQQEGAVCLIRTIDEFDCGRCRRGKAPCFRSFLFAVVRDRLRQLARRSRKK
jgi:DNA-directed RNA polymerase specialized sigma subunit